MIGFGFPGSYFAANWLSACLDSPIGLMVPGGISLRRGPDAEKARTKLIGEGI
jgi:hypothetical protein